MPFPRIHLCPLQPCLESLETVSHSEIFMAGDSCPMASLVFLVNSGSELEDSGCPSPTSSLTNDDREPKMNRSTLNQYIAEATEFFAQRHFVLPPFASWTPEDWQKAGDDAAELKAQRLGWDVTDFNSGDFASIGLIMFTLRNGLAASTTNTKPYAEKIMMVRNGQVTPYHYHAQKMEDIINRGSKNDGRLFVQLYKSINGGAFSEEPFTVYCDGIVRHINPGGHVTLGPGESITLPPFLYHTFHAIDGDALIGEVSSVNDDNTDNYFRDPVGR